MSITPEPARELNTWKEISAYLGVSVRTAQDYETQLGLPVHRLPGRGKPRVRAIRSELDEWRVRESIRPPTPERLAQEDKSTPKSFARLVFAAGFRRVLSFGFALTAVLGFVAYWVVARNSLIGDYVVQDKNLIVVDSKGRELWRYAFPERLVEADYLDEAHSNHGWIGDLDGAGRRALIVLIDPWNRASVGTSAICFDANGKQRWQFIPGRPVVDASGDRMAPPFFTSNVQVIGGRSRADTRIAISSNHYLGQANQVAFLDGNGRVIGEYWHPGHLIRSGQVDLEGEGRRDLLLAGVNNGNHQATLVILDPSRVSGMVTPKVMQDHRFELLNMPPADERATVFFPRSCISTGQPYTRATHVHVTKGRIVVTVAEGVNDRDCGFVYELDYNLRVVNVVPNSIGVERKHKELEAQGQLDHTFNSAQECARLKAGVIVRRGG